MEKNEYLESLNNFYSLKHKYENNLKNSKYALIQNKDMTKEEKRNKFLKKKKLCVNCQQEGGTLFTITKSNLSATCGNKNTPCDLNINIKKKHYKESNVLCEILQDEMNTIKRNIIINKMDLLYQYKTEDEIVSIFEKLKEDLTNISLSYEEAMHHYFQVVDNKIKKEEILKFKKDMHNYLNDIKDLNNEYLETKNIELLKNGIQIYKENVIPIINNIQRVQYKNMYINYDDSKTNEIHLIQNEYTISDLEIEI